MESFEVLVAVSHHSAVDAAHPIGLRQSECQSDDYHDDEGNVLAEDGLESQCQSNRDEEYDELDDELQFVFDLVLSGNLIIQGQCLFVPDSQLEEQTVFRSCGDEKVGEYHQQ